MTPKEKAKELYNKFYNTSSHPHHVESRKNNAKQCALIAVDEMIKELERCFIHNEYWQEVKQEIEKL
jgi:hypothetical protein